MGPILVPIKNFFSTKLRIQPKEKGAQVKVHGAPLLLPG
jgi:hypothetical protein